MSPVHTLNHFLQRSIANTLIKKLQCMLKEDLKMQEQENTGPVRHRMWWIMLAQTNQAYLGLLWGNTEITLDWQLLGLPPIWCHYIWHYIIVRQWQWKPRWSEESNRAASIKICACKCFQGKEKKSEARQLKGCWAQKCWYTDNFIIIFFRSGFAVLQRQPGRGAGVSGWHFKATGCKTEDMALGSLPC